MNTKENNWLAVLLISIGSFVIINTEFMPVGLLSEISTYYNISTSQAGLLITMPGISAAISAPTLLLLSRGWDRRLIIVSMLSIVVLSNVLTYEANYFGWALFARLLLGISIGGFWSFSIPYGIKLVENKNRNRATAIITAGISAGTVIGVPLGTYLGVEIGWKNTFLINGIFSGCILILQLMKIPSQKSDIIVNFNKVVEIVMVPAIAQRLISGLLYGSAHFTAFTYYEPLILSGGGMSNDVLPEFMFIYGISGLLGTLIAERLISLFSARWTLFISIFLVSFSAISLITVSSGFFTISVITFFWGTAFGLMPVSINVWLVEASGKNYEIVSTINVTAFQIAIALGSIIGGIASAYLGLRAPFILAIVMGFLCMRAISFNLKIRRKEFISYD